MSSNSLKFTQHRKSSHAIMEYTSYEIFEVGSKTACQTRPVYPRGRTIMIHWMNTLFVLRNLFPVKRFCAINLAQQHIFPREVARTIVCFSKSHLPSIKDHSFKSIFSVSEKATMSGCGAENSSILDNLRKSVKEQVCIYIFFVGWNITCSGVYFILYQILHM